ncbi:MAG TPA: chitobiase/beta-hexosaminidase C-terminal domain-containing protein [Candidatus Diapherotrites archaeon]|nr:chitobiase/beta-hexosaminidase C-terminal domain-containing protein [Candidatus Diapherotrites archaeon]
MRITRKGVSEIITITIIIAITVILTGMFLAWAKNSSKNKMDEISAELRSASDLECLNAEFYVDSCTILNTTKTIRLTIINNSNLKLFNLNLSINGDTSVAGVFQDNINPGEMAFLSTDTDFNFTRGDQSTLRAMDIDTIDNITLTNGTCPKEILDISGCTVVNTFWPPTASVASGTYYVEQSVTLSAENGTTIYYTIDGSTPTTESPVYSSAITIPEDTTRILKAIASAEGFLASDVNTWVYNVTHKLGPPTATPPAGTYSGATEITLTCDEEADIYYIVTQGPSATPPLPNTPYTGPIKLSPNEHTQTIRARCVKSGYGDSTISSFEYTINDSSESKNSVDYNRISGELTITLNPDITTEEGMKFLVYDNNEKYFIQTDTKTTASEMSNAAPSPYVLDNKVLSTIQFDINLFLTYYSKSNISHFDIVGGKDNVLATIPANNISVISKQ